MKRSKKWVIGIDEVGRGALAGPVVVCAALISRGIRFPKKLGKLKDSKRLSPKKREAWCAYFKDRSGVKFATACVHPRRIEKMNISRAANLAALRAYARLIANGGSRIANARVFLDGGLFLGNGGRTANANTMIRGDEKISAVAIASIIAKVRRDRFMVRLAKKYPAYGFGVHKGYGTARHYGSIKKHGLCGAHRTTFCGLSGSNPDRGRVGLG